MSGKPTIYINDRLSSELARYQVSMHPSNSWRRKMNWWIPWAKDLEEKLATTLYELEQVKAELEHLKSHNT